eukprot:CAMPEP_0171848478 /NCGR_PEP_ID=MMETSP0992-20121227/19020_1 /TAXON_ID=483369 /ORGANISM="non described non described, Strain CCMP2098" /LENGTH=79 /DNA_ID=CAMNT_0012467335 /DNA_START=70 /DNA_END=309 /DNA_ORIENTATION=-
MSFVLPSVGFETQTSFVLPSVGFETQILKSAEDVFHAIKAGHRLFDCAFDHENLTEVSEGIQANHIKPQMISPELSMQL